MRIREIRERTVGISRYADPKLPPGGLTTSAVAVVADPGSGAEPVVGYGFSSFGRYGQSGLIRERFAPRLLAAPPAELLGGDGRLDPFAAWNVMMRGEKPGGHGERCVAVGTLDMALWDAAAKAAGIPLYQLLAERTGNVLRPTPSVRVYAGGGYPYPSDDAARLADEIAALTGRGYTDVKIKIATSSLAHDARRIEAAAAALGDASRLAVDAMNAYDSSTAPAAAAVLAPYGLRWFEDVCDPLDFETQAAVASAYDGAIAAGEALFSAAEARLLLRYGGLRHERDVLLFDPVHCYGIAGFLAIVETFERAGWRRSAFWPHGGHLFGLHVVRGLGLGGAEVNPLCFAPFGGLADDGIVRDGSTVPPHAPGIGFETKADLHRLFASI